MAMSCSHPPHFEETGQRPGNPASAKSIRFSSLIPGSRSTPGWHFYVGITAAF